MPAHATETPSELSYAERLLWAAEHVEGPQPVVPFLDCPPALTTLIPFDHRPQVAALRASLDEVIGRHEVLRSTFVRHDGRPVRVIRPARSIEIAELDASSTSDGDAATAVVRRQAMTPFSLAEGPLVRASLLTLGSGAHVLALTVHHIVFDQWSKQLLADELTRAYQAHLAGADSPLEPLPAAYHDYVQWQHEQVTGARGRELARFWTERLRAMSAVALPHDGHAASTRSATCPFTIPAATADRLRAISQRARVTLATTMLAVLAVFLRDAGGNSEVTIGVPVSDRRRHEFERLIGLFTNVVIVRAAVRCDATGQQAIACVHRAMTEAYRYQDMPYGRLVQLIGLNAPLFRVAFNFIPMPQRALYLRPRLSSLASEDDRVRALADLTLHVRAGSSGELACRFSYKSDVFATGRVQGFAREFDRLVHAVVAAPHAPVGTPMAEC
jgi:hypothetical protein